MLAIKAKSDWLVCRHSAQWGYIDAAAKRNHWLRIAVPMHIICKAHVVYRAVAHVIHSIPTFAVTGYDWHVKTQRRITRVNTKYLTEHQRLLSQRARHQIIAACSVHIALQQKQCTLRTGLDTNNKPTIDNRLNLPCPRGVPATAYGSSTIPVFCQRISTTRKSFVCWCTVSHPTTAMLIIHTQTHS